MRRAMYAALAAWWMLTGCAFKPQDRLDVNEVSFGALAGWLEDDHADALTQFQRHCEALLKKDDDAVIGEGLLAANARNWKGVCRGALALRDAESQTARVFFETHFTPLRASNRGKERGLFTGYYVPQLRGSRTRRGPYQTPIYALPPELRKGTPFHSRQHIDMGILAGRGLELAYVDDPVMLFFMHIQGSGFITLEDGTDMLLGYAGQNGHAYTALGKTMKEQGLLSGDIHFFVIRDWLYAHPKEAQTLMWQNPSYVFFKHLEDREVKGAAGVELAPGRSLAVDRRFIPYGMLLFLDTELPGAYPLSAMPFQRLMVAGDTGGAIKGPVRGDIYFGRGPDAELRAGYQKQQGTVTLLVPNLIASRLQ